MQIVTILRRDNRKMIGHRIECANTAFTRLIGLLGRNTLNAGEGIWIRPSSGIHSFGMRFPIDVVGLDRNMRVVKLWRNVKPQRITSVSWNTCSVLELAAGEIDAHSVCIGEALCALPIRAGSQGGPSAAT